MQNSQGFNFDQPSRDALVGIYMEVCDSEAAAAKLRAGQEGPDVVAELERLFGHTLTVDDENTAAWSSREEKKGSDTMRSGLS